VLPNFNFEIGDFLPGTRIKASPTNFRAPDAFWRRVERQRRDPIPFNAR
jgi:hypothetical protein